ncbi:hypothetical protein ACWC2T_15785 [Streptomyces sp. NPDC001393]
MTLTDGAVVVAWDQGSAACDMTHGKRLWAHTEPASPWSLFRLGKATAVQPAALTCPVTAHSGLHQGRYVLGRIRRIRSVICARSYWRSGGRRCRGPRRPNR